MAAYGVLFVCTGNICRSPTAEGVFRHRVKALGLADRIFADSAGTHGYHIGNAPDARTIAVAKRKGFDLTGLCARQINESDFHQFDLITAMDRSHMRILEKLKPENSRAELRLFCDFVEEANTADVPDPYYGGPEGFDMVLQMVSEGVEGILAAIEELWQKETRQL